MSRFRPAAHSAHLPAAHYERDGMAGRPGRYGRSTRRAARVFGGGLAVTGLLAAGFAASAPTVAFANGVTPGSGQGVSRGDAAAGPSTVYTETNQVSGNEVLAYRSGPSGTLTPIGSFSTGGTGTGTSPASEGGVVLGDGGHLLAVVNGGSDNVSVFAVAPSGRLRLIDITNSGGVDPISVTVRGGLVYVLNTGNATSPPDIAGFDIVGPPFLRRPFATQALNPAASSPEQIGFSPDGRDLVVTEKTSNTIDVFPVNALGIAGAAVTTTIPGDVGPYGFVFTPTGLLAVTEAATSALATFDLNPSGTLQAISTVPDGEQAPCWVALTANGSEAFVSNAHNGTISAYSVALDGTLSLLAPAAQATVTTGNTDLALGGSTLYIGDAPGVDATTISPAGTLSSATTAVTGLPAGTFGLAAVSTPAFAGNHG